MYKVIKRNNQRVAYDFDKIKRVIEKAFNACSNNYQNNIIELLALRVTSDFEAKIINDEIHVEDIQDSVEKILFESGYSEVAKQYIIYRKQHERFRMITSVTKDYENMMDDYVKKDNPEKIRTIGDMLIANSGAITKNYWLHNIFDEDIKRAYYEGFINYQDLNYLTPSALKLSIKKLIDQGLVGQGVHFRKAKHFDSIINHLNHLLYGIGNEWSKQIEITDFDIYLAPYVKNDGLNYEEVKQVLESFVYSLNLNNLFGNRRIPCVINLSFIVPDGFKNDKCIINDQELHFSYSELATEIAMIDRALINILIEGDANFDKFHYPVIKVADYHLLNRIDQDIKNTLFKAIDKGLTVIIENNEYSLKGILSIACINIPMIINNSSDYLSFYKLLEHYLKITIRSLKIKRKIIMKLFDEGLYTVSDKYLTNIDDFKDQIVFDNFEAIIDIDYLKDKIDDIASLINHNFDDVMLESFDFINIENSNKHLEGHRFDNLFEKVSFYDRLAKNTNSNLMININFEKDHLDYLALGNFIHKIMNDYHLRIIFSDK